MALPEVEPHSLNNRLNRSHNWLNRSHNLLNRSHKVAQQNCFFYFWLPCSVLPFSQHFQSNHLDRAQSFLLLHHPHVVVVREVSCQLGCSYLVVGEMLEVLHGLVVGELCWQLAGLGNSCSCCSYLLVGELLELLVVLEVVGKRSGGGLLWKTSHSS